MRMQTFYHQIIGIFRKLIDPCLPDCPLTLALLSGIAPEGRCPDNHGSSVLRTIGLFKFLLHCSFISFIKITIRIAASVRPHRLRMLHPHRRGKKRTAVRTAHRDKIIVLIDISLIKLRLPPAMPEDMQESTRLSADARPE